MGIAEKKVELLKIVADADKGLVNAMLIKLIEHYTANPDSLTDELLKVMSEKNQPDFGNEHKLQTWEEIKQRLQNTVNYKD